ncbi:TonB-dependent receptor [Sphingomonas sp. ERG5]|uniref:TonB-dependent receptor n=1 Tax=Sphingomonas sp. ERG5 TaxID=1381597 RepID=UPI00068E805B|nr:TonB-dependent receptor [Sphingomonas sp. ERG5]
MPTEPRHPRFHAGLKALLLATAITGMTGTAHAQTATDETAATPAETEQGGDIVVTALKRSTSIQNTPLAITAVTGQTLGTMGITDSTSLARVSPGLVVRESGFSGSRLTIRNIRAAGEATVGLYYDETPVIGSAGVNADAGGTTPTIRLFDVERVEVLRGPQGTLYGSSSMAGTVRMIFNKPDLETISATVAGQMSDVAHGGIGFQNQAMVNVPLIDGKLAIRAVGFYQDAPGYIDNITLGQKDINGQVSKGGRLMLRAEPIEGLTIDALAVIQNQRGSLNDYYLAAGAYKTTYEAREPLSDKTRLYSGTINWDLGPVTLTAIGSHAYRDFNYSYDFSSFFRTFGALYPVGSPNYIAFNSQAPSVANSPQITKTDSAEARISSSGHGPLQWTAGFYYSNRDGDFQSNIVRVNPGNGEILPITASTLLGQRVITDQLKQTAGFGEATYEITDRLSVTGGIRYFHYSRRVTGAVTVPDPIVGFVAGPATDQSSSENGWLYKANASYKLADRVMVYATASSGQRPGGVNQTVGLPASLQTYSSDHLWNYELGLKSMFFDRMLTFNADIFQIDWQNMQTSGTLPGTNFAFIANAGKARVRGAEVEATLVPLTGLQLQASGSYIDAHLLENQANQTLVAPGLKGDPIPYVPKATVQGSVQYSWALSPNLKGLLRSDVYYSGSSWTEFRHTSAFQRELPAYATIGLRAGISDADDDWSVALFANNLTNSAAIVAKLSANAFGGLDKVRAISITPRTIGIDLMKHF